MAIQLIIIKIFFTFSILNNLTPIILMTEKKK